MAGTRGITQRPKLRASRRLAASLPGRATGSFSPRYQRIRTPTAPDYLVYAREVSGSHDAGQLYRSPYLLSKRPGIRRIRSHDLWHTAATLLLEQAAHAKSFAEIARPHRSVGHLASAFARHGSGGDQRRL